MDTLYVGDVHGCAAELQDLLQLAPDARVVLLGDLFTRGPDPLGVWRAIQDRRCETILGNHDARVIQRWREDPAKLRATPVAALMDEAPEALAYLEAAPVFRFDDGLIAVHAGVHPLLGPAGTPRHMAIHLRRFPDDRQADNPFWYDAGWTGPLVVFGHDAMRGLVRRQHQGRPTALGLDTACVYGGALTGWLRGEDRLISVKARRAYCPVG
ncbi:MAG: metallophosphoesterase [Deltaproteobacteria bacterium]|nr:metallophosphoesterase [Deltaproteobacteria bacterium]MBK9645493.1 metallophosphoesterase [Deltaproteobacteria bacterium]